MSASRQYLQRSWSESLDASHRARVAYRLLILLLSIVALGTAFATTFALAPWIFQSVGAPFDLGAPLSGAPTWIAFALTLLALMLLLAVAFPVCWAIAAVFLRFLGTFSREEATAFAKFGALPERCKHALDGSDI
jgi:hypothetical protein